MRMLLTSNGIANARIHDALVDLVGKPIAECRVVVVLDGILGFPGDSSTLVDHLEQLRALGWAELDLASLFAGPPSLVESRLCSADVILGYGGSNLWSAHAWAATGLAPVLATLLEKKVYVGWSAGSMIFGRGLGRWAEAFDDQDELDMFGLDAVEPVVPLFDWFFMGHLGADWMPEDAEAWAARGAARTRSPLWFVDDESALLVRDPDADPVVISAGSWRRFGVDGTLEESHPAPDEEATAASGAPRWLPSPQRVLAAREHIEHDATIAWQRTDDDRWTVTAVCPAFGTAEALADDAFEALCLVREQLEPYGWRIGVAGAQRDVWPSGMARDQGGGKVAYRFGSHDIVEVFQPVAPATVTTVAEQQAAAEAHYGGRMRSAPSA